MPNKLIKKMERDKNIGIDPETTPVLRGELSLIDSLTKNIIRRIVELKRKKALKDRK